MRIDQAVNYSSFMQHYNPMDVMPVQSVQSENISSVSSEGVNGYNGVGADSGKDIAAGGISGQAPKEDKSVTSYAGVSSERDGIVTLKSGTANATAGKKASSIEDIAIDFSRSKSEESSGIGGFRNENIRKAISGMEKDTMLHEYQYFVGSRRAQTLVNNDDGMVLKLA